ncbi:hypothetical protein GYMLUDRAFT_247429 [Collybiopsis luxurians FD-317 M1]|uniref:Uncharacterized protein n=1 Tax=Collybiopsis luxurians FD-317 M1 TaxID=944289 RepID=A0A0D0CFK6_9AGAR|nr:hypothetical protein GYMLUDRAFT_247429 [Collybiopsis luxurians FD-317 M1]
MTTTSALSFPCPSTSSLQTLVDDSDVTHIQYSGGWTTFGNPDFECNGTTHGSSLRTGFLSNATFSFEGVGVQVFGTIGLSGIPLSTYQLDHLPIFKFAFNGDTKNLTTYRVQFYTSPQLEPGNHTLVISSPGNNSSQLFLDYILYNPIPTATPSPSTLPFSKSLTTSTTAMPTRVSSSPQSPQITSLSAGTFAGGIVGGSIIGLALGIILTFIFFRRRKNGDTRPTSIMNQTVTAPSSMRPTSATTTDDSATTLSTVAQITKYIQATTRTREAVPSVAVSLSTSPDGPPSYVGH